MKTLFTFLLVLVLTLPAFSQDLKATDYDFPKPVDTSSREIQYQEKKIFSDKEGGVFATNNFPAARLNNFERVNSRFYNVTIKPENSPINPSAWYAFKIF